MNSAWRKREAGVAENLSTRLAFGYVLAEFGANPDVFVLDADLACCTMSKYFQEKYPERFFNIGIAEGNMVGVAAGIATTGKNVFACSFCHVRRRARLGTGA